MSSVKEVAKRANVSVATVSRVLNNDPVVKQSTKEKVLEVIKEMNYKPNLLAKNLRKQASKTIVMVLPAMSNPYFAEIARGAQAAAYDFGYHIIIGTMESKRWILDTYVNLLKTNLAEGMIFVSSSADRELLQTLVGDYPIVLCTENYPGIGATCVSIDNKQAGYEATRELLRRGHRSIAYIAGNRQSSSVLGRIEGYKEALIEAGIEYNPELVAGSKNNFENVTEAMNGILGKGFGIDGVITHSDLQASYILKGIKENLIPLEASIGLISFDGTFIAEITNPSITTIVQPLYDLGYTSVHQLVLKLQNDLAEAPQGVVILPHELVIRET
ncbi:LacI family DNA-binding transcriptional regulator [Paenibacillus allorhizosphaerae]|uniref:HTH-type transcriptional repressor CytR n=1 Tax=Paenibacillus allorhizosphaerae TaxID=2849866 RepID=A0ABM8VIH8_9BACL|nr:LacI family DNA-binding transcriptional regulator [Paenibacillus allorhizosphaerae]CAG7643257.1 HTH-type transcriptional repressor CytR [Paenibacillus allorhizosphaerae]